MTGEEHHPCAPYFMLTPILEWYIKMINSTVINLINYFNPWLSFSRISSHSGIIQEPIHTLSFQTTMHETFREWTLEVSWRKWDKIGQCLLHPCRLLHSRRHGLSSTQRSYRAGPYYLDHTMNTSNIVTCTGEYGLQEHSRRTHNHLSRADYKAEWPLMRENFFKKNIKKTSFILWQKYTS